MNKSLNIRNKSPSSGTDFEKHRGKMKEFKVFLALADLPQLIDSILIRNQMDDHSKMELLKPSDFNGYFTGQGS